MIKYFVKLFLFSTVVYFPMFSFAQGNDFIVESVKGSSHAVSEKEGIAESKSSGSLAPLSLQPLANTNLSQPKNKKSKLAFIDKALKVKPVKPWQKGKLAEQQMKPGGAIPSATKFARKIYASKENTRGGLGVGGGGCGCN